MNKALELEDEDKALEDILKDLDGNVDKDVDGAADKTGGGETIESLKVLLEEREKKIAGLLKETKAQRRKRQDTEERLNKLTDTVQTILTKRNVLSDDKKNDKQADDTITLNYDKEGNPIVSRGQLKGDLVDPEVRALQEKIANLEANLQATRQVQESESEATKIISTIVGSDERFGPAYNKYQTARSWVEEKVIEFQKDNDISGFMSSGQALDYVFDKELRDEFKKNFPGMNLDSVVIAEDSKTTFKNTLSEIADSMTPGKGNDGKGNLKQLLSKPSGHGRSANALGGQVSLEETLGSLTATDILNMPEDKIASLEKLLAKQGD